MSAASSAYMLPGTRRRCGCLDRSRWERRAGVRRDRAGVPDAGLACRLCRKKLSGAWLRRVVSPEVKSVERVLQVVLLVRLVRTRARGGSPGLDPLPAPPRRARHARGDRIRARHLHRRGGERVVVAGGYGHLFWCHPATRRFGVVQYPASRRMLLRLRDFPRG